VFDLVAVVVLESDAVEEALGIGEFVRDKELDWVVVFVPEGDRVFALESETVGEVVLDAVLV
jgi:hypothetical protein